MKRLFLLFPLSLFSMHTHLFYPDLFEEEVVPTERYVYEGLKKNPLPDEIHFLAVPWAQVINRNLPYPEIQLNGGFTVCQHVDFEKIIPHLKKIGIDTLFTPHVTKDYEGINVLPYPHFPINGCEPEKEKSLLYSFAGLDSHPCRKPIFEKLTGKKGTWVIKREHWHFWNGNVEEEAREYQSLLSKSRFSLCPRGVGASTIRFWESIQAGAIPILISDAMRLPDGVKWEKCALFVKEKHVKYVPTLLRFVSKKKEKKMRKRCLELYQKYLTKENFANFIWDHYAKPAVACDPEGRGRMGDHFIHEVKGRFLAKEKGLPFLEKMPKYHPRLVLADFYYRHSRWEDAFELGTWDNILGDEMLRNTFRARFPLKSFPKEETHVAIHIRKGSGDDPPLFSEQLFHTVEAEGVPQVESDFADVMWPDKFPPTQYYVEKIRSLAPSLENATFHLFTDSQEYKLLAEDIEKETGFAIETHPGNSPEEDIALMAACDYLIRSRSNFAQIAHLIGNHKRVIFPQKITWHGNKLLVE